MLAENIKNCMQMFNFFQLKVNKILIFILEKVFKIFFKQELGDKAKNFINNFGFLATAEILASFIGFPIKILAGRFLGPVEYGKYSLILSVAQFFIIPMLLGFVVAALRYIPEHKDLQKQITSWLQVFFTVTTILTVFFLILNKTWWLKVFGISVDMFYYALIFSIFLAIFNLYDAFNRSFHRFKVVSSVAIINSIVLLLAFLLFLFGFGIKNYQSFIIANILSLATSLFVLGRFIFKSGFSFSLPKDIFNKIFKYSTVSVIGAFTGFIILNSDRFFLNHFNSFYFVGIYAAYTNAANVFVGRFFQLFLNVYFPSISGEQDKNKIKDFIRKVLKIFLIGAFILSFFSIWLIIWLFGKKFPVDFTLITLFSLNNCFFIFYQLYMWLLNSEGMRGVGFVLKTSFLVSMLNLSLLFILVPLFGIYGAIISSIILNIIFSLVFYIKTKNFFKNEITN